jgi:Rrf2 family protein
MIRIARQTEYAARVLSHLASLEAESSAAIAEISRQRLMPAPFVRRVVARLVGAGILKTIRGSKGGVQLGRPAAKISLLDLMEAMENPIALNECERFPDKCPFSSSCPVRQAWISVSAALARHLASIRFDALARGANDHAIALVKIVAKPARRPARRCSYP